MSAGGRPGGGGGGGGAPVEVRVGSGELRRVIIVVSMLFVQQRERREWRETGRGREEN